MLVLFLNFSWANDPTSCSLQKFLHQAYEKLHDYENAVFQFTRTGWVTENEFKIYGNVNGKEEVIGRILVLPQEQKGISFDIFVHESTRGKGVQNILYAEALSKFSNQSKIYHALDGTNLDIYLENLSWALIKRYNLAFPDPFIYDTPEKIYRHCCAHVFSDMPEALRNQHAIKAIVNTPAYKSSARFGFPKICDVQTFRGIDSVVFTSCP